MSNTVKPHRARKRFGQHFLTDANVVANIVAAIQPQSNDHLVEIGPGLGDLTVALLPLVHEMDAVELDRDVIPKLAERCGTTYSMVTDLYEYPAQPAGTSFGDTTIVSLTTR